MTTEPAAERFSGKWGEGRDHGVERQPKARRSKIAVPFIDIPSETVDTDGFLKEEYAQKFLLNGEPDPHHANERCGRLMMEKVIAHVAQLEQA